MAEASIHIHIDTPVDIEAVDKILTAAMEAKEITLPAKIPPGYRCAICFAADGGHAPGCTVMQDGGTSVVIGR